MTRTTTISLDKAYLIAIWLETLFYGVNIVLFGSYLYISRYKHRARQIKRVIMVSAITMFLFSTIHVSLGLVRLIQGFIEFRDAPGGPAAFVADTSAPVNVAKIIIHTINSIIGDSIVVWRCYHVWAANIYICILPILLIVASAVSGLGQGIIFVQDKTGDGTFVVAIEHWNGAVFSLSLVTNVIVTSLIACRVWYDVYLNREFASRFKGASFKYKRVLALVIESGMIYSSTLVIEITLYFLNNDAYYIIYDPIAQLTGIVPTMIIVMVGLGLTSHDLTTRVESVQQAATGTRSHNFPARHHHERKARPELSTIEFATMSLQPSTATSDEGQPESRGAVFPDVEKTEEAPEGGTVSIDDI